MREYSLSVNEENTSRSVEFNFSTDGGCDFLTIKTFKSNKIGELDSTSVSIDAHDAERIIEFMQIFESENACAERRKKGA